jgi:hypothetical protein
MVIRLGRNGKFLLPHAPSTEAALPGRRRRSWRIQPCPMRRGFLPPGAAGSAPSSAARGTPTAATSAVTARRPRSSSRSRWCAPGTATAGSPRVARGAPATSSGGAPTTRAASSRPTIRRRGRSTTRTTTAGAPWPARAMPGCA